MMRHNTGVVKWFSKRLGYGFISPENLHEDVFVHISEVKQAGLRDLLEGQKVIFDTKLAKTGRQCASSIFVLG